MGSGKSTLAPLLANMLGYEHIDLDREIERKSGLLISEIFRIHGEQYFRDLERSLLINFSTRKNLVIALGGGTITYNNNIAIMKSTGLVVYLKTSPEIIIRRVKRNQNRPLLQDEDGTLLTEDALRARIQNLLTLREPFYTQADVTLEIGNARVAFTVDKLVRKLRGMVEG